MQLKLISFKLCPFVHRAAILLQEKGVVYDIDYIDLKNKPDWFLEISPLGKVPVLCVDGKPLFESLAILDFLDEAFTPSMHPGDLFVKARNRAFFAIIDQLFGANYQLNIAKNEEDYQAALKSLADGFNLLENEVKGPYFNGNEFAFIDVVIAPVFFRLSLLEDKTGNILSKYPGVENWSNKLVSLDAVKQSVVPDFKEIYLVYLESNEAWLLKK